MCLGVPGRVVTIEDGPLRLGVVDFGGVRRKVALVYVPETRVGDWCIVHVGFAISRLDEAEALRTRAALEELAAQELADALADGAIDRGGGA